MLVISSKASKGVINQIKSNQIKSNQIKSYQIKSNQIKSNQIKSNQIKSRILGKGLDSIKQPELKTLEWWIFTRLNNACSSLVINLHIH